MPLISFEDFNNDLVNDRIPSGAVYLADTCFLLLSIDTSKNRNLQSLAKNIRVNMTKKNVALAYNVTIQNELHHRIRSMLVESILKKPELKIKNEAHKCVKEHESKDASKALVRSGYGNLVATALGEKGCEVEKLVQRAVINCSYRSGLSLSSAPTIGDNRSKPDLNWTQVRQLMAEYALDSSDAMILNMGLQDKRVSGIITADSDFRYVGCSSFQIITQDVFLDRTAYPISLQWSE